LAIKFHKDLKKQQDEDEQRKMIDKDIEEQQKNEANPDTIESYAQNWYLLISNKTKYEFHKDKMTYFKSMYDLRAKSIREQNSKFPSYESEWLPLYKKRLEERGESDIYELLKLGHEKLSSEIFIPIKEK
jgi:hypothetical protein